jgi:hypothetical protein
MSGIPQVNDSRYSMGRQSVVCSRPYRTAVAAVWMGSCVNRSNTHCSISSCK